MTMLAVGCDKVTSTPKCSMRLGGGRDSSAGRPAPALRARGQNRPTSCTHAPRPSTEQCQRPSLRSALCTAVCRPARGSLRGKRDQSLKNQCGVRHMGCVSCALQNSAADVVGSLVSNMPTVMRINRNHNQWAKQSPCRHRASTAAGTICGCDRGRERPAHRQVVAPARSRRRGGHGT